jgi:solute:Na+ symporter, SSS family
LRWFWWRVNAWAEIAAMTGSFVFALGFHIAQGRGLGWPPHHTLVATVFGSMALWLAVTYLSPKTDRATLRRFYEKVRPAGPGWREIRAETGLPPSPDNLPSALLASALCATAVWSALFATGSYLYGHQMKGALLAALALATGVGGFRLALASMWRKSR